MILNRIFFTFLVLLIPIFSTAQKVEDIKNDKIKVLNFATIHLTNSTDANTSYVDINNPKVKKDIEQIVSNLVEFNPTIICVEIPSEATSGLNEIYKKYIVDQTNKTNWTAEINEIVFEVGRLSDVKEIYGIDARLGFDYPKLMEIAENDESKIQFIDQNQKSIERFNSLPLLKQFQEINSNEWKSETFNSYNFLSTIHTKNNYEGADIIAEFYKRNLRIYSNFSDIPIETNDRVLIILGGTHTAYLDIFLKNNPKYELIDATEYTNYRK